MPMEYKEMEIVLKAISDETRLKIISYLSKDSFCGCELVEFLDMSQPAVSQHLKRLREAGVTKEEKRGKWVYYSLNKNHELYSFLLHIAGSLPFVKISAERMICD